MPTSEPEPEPERVDLCFLTSQWCKRHATYKTQCYIPVGYFIFVVAIFNISMAVLGGYFMITETLRYFNPIENGLLPFTKRSLILELLSYVGNVVFVFALFYLFLGLMTNFGVPVMLIWGFWQRRSNECQMWIATNIGTLGVISGIVIFECIEKLCNQDGPLALTMFGVWLLIFAIFLYGQFVVLNVITILEAEEALAPRPPTPLPPTPPRPAYFPRMGPLPLGSTSFGPPKKRRLRYVSRP